MHRPEHMTPARRWYLANQSFEANPGEPAGLTARAAAFLAMGRPWEAVSDLDKALRLAVQSVSFAPQGMAARRSREEDEARIRLLRGHAHAACLRYDRAVGDFHQAEEMLRSLERAPRGAAAREATSAHALAGMGVAYCNMREWRLSIEAGERAMERLPYGDIARTHVSRAVETARQHLQLERMSGRGGLRRPPEPDAPPQPPPPPPKPPGGDGGGPPAPQPPPPPAPPGGGGSDVFQPPQPPGLAAPPLGRAFVRCEPPPSIQIRVTAHPPSPGPAAPRPYLPPVPAPTPVVLASVPAPAPKADSGDESDKGSNGRLSIASIAASLSAASLESEPPDVEEFDRTDPAAPEPAVGLSVDEPASPSAPTVSWAPPVPRSPSRPAAPRSPSPAQAPPSPFQPPSPTVASPA